MLITKNCANYTTNVQKIVYICINLNFIVSIAYTADANLENIYDHNACPYKSVSTEKSDNFSNQGKLLLI